MRFASIIIAAIVATTILAAPAKPLAGKTICIDPGHPSENGSGARGSKIGEVHANWMVALKLKAALQAMGAKVVMTKSKESEKVTNRKRAEIGNAAKAALMIRLHCDATSGSGFAVYYPDKAGTVKGVSGPGKSVLTASAKIAKAFYPAMVKSLSGKLKGRGLKTDRATLIGGKQGALTGSIFSKVPVVLVEMVNLQSKSDDSFIAEGTGQAAVAKAIAAGIVAGLK